MEERHDETPQAVGNLERQITRLLEQLQHTVQPPAFSHRIEGIRPILVRLMEDWGRYRRAARPFPSGFMAEPTRRNPRGTPPAETGCGLTDDMSRVCGQPAIAVDSRHGGPVCLAHAPVENHLHPVPLTASQYFTDFPYTVPELDALFTAARLETVRQGGRYDVGNTMITLWAPPRPERQSRIEMWAFQWGRPPRLWAISTEADWTLMDLLQELGRLELKALGHLKHGEMLGQDGQLLLRHTCSIGSWAGETIREGIEMRLSDRVDRRLPSHYEAARVELRCRATAAHVRQLSLEHVTIYADGWAHWVEEGHVYVGYVQSGRCCDLPEVSAL